MKKNAIFEDFFFLSDEKKRENEEGIRYRMKEISLMGLEKAGIAKRRDWEIQV